MSCVGVELSSLDITQSSTMLWLEGSVRFLSLLVISSRSIFASFMALLRALFVDS